MYTNEFLTKLNQKLIDQGAKTTRRARIFDLEKRGIVPIQPRDKDGWRIYDNHDLIVYEEAVVLNSKPGRPLGSTHETICKQCSMIDWCKCPHNKWGKQ